MEELNECYSKLMEYVYCIDRCLNLSANNKKLARLSQYKNPNINEMDHRNLIIVCRDLNPLTLEGKCLLETSNSKITKYTFKKPQEVKDDMFRGTPVNYVGNSYEVKEVCLYNQKWLKEYYTNPYELLSKAGTKKEDQIELIEKQKLKKEKREVRKTGKAPVKGSPLVVKTNGVKNHSNPSSNVSTPAFCKRNKKNENNTSTPDRKKQLQHEQQQQQQKQDLPSPNCTPNSTPIILPRKTVLQSQHTPVSVVQMDKKGLPVTVTRTPMQQPQVVVVTPTKQYTQQPPLQQQQYNNNNFRVLTTAEPIVTPTSKKYNNNKEKTKSKLVIDIKEPEKKEKFVWCCCEESKGTACCYDFARNVITFCLLIVFLTMLTLRFVKYMNYSSSLLQKYAIVAMFSLLGIVIEILEMCINCCKIQSLHYMGYRIYSGVISLYYILIAIYTLKCDSSLPYMCFFCMAFVHLFGMCWKKPSEK